MSFDPDRVSTVTFDFYSTLVDVDAAVAALADRVTDPEPVSRLWRSCSLAYTFVASQTGAYQPFYEMNRDAHQYALDAHGVDLPAGAGDELLAMYHELDVFEDVREESGRLVAAGYDTRAVSSGGPAAGVDSRPRRRRGPGPGHDKRGRSGDGRTRGRTLPPRRPDRNARRPRRPRGRRLVRRRGCAPRGHPGGVGRPERDAVGALRRRTRPDCRLAGRAGRRARRPR